MNDGVKVSIPELEKQIEELTSLQNELNEEKSEVDLKKKEMMDNWSGDEADKAIEMIEQTCNTLEKCFANLEEHKNDLRTKKDGFESIRI